MCKTSPQTPSFTLTNCKNCGGGVRGERATRTQGRSDSQIIYEGDIPLLTSSSQLGTDRKLWSNRCKLKTLHLER